MNSLASISAGRSIPAASRNRSASIHAGRSIPTANRNRSGSIHAGRSIPAASRNKPASIHAGKHIPTGRINKPAPFPTGNSVPTGWTNPAARPFLDQQTYLICRGVPRTMVDLINLHGFALNNPQGRLKSMTRNREKLDDFVQVKGGTVTFGGGDVLTKDFQLPDESQVVLRILRRHDLYTFNLSDIQPKQHINCLLAKASLEESTKWHRRMAHVNFKTINKLAKHGLVEGLPLKLFTNEHNCVACNKGKQHKASYKAIFAVRTISEPLQLLYMDLFGPTSIRSIDHKYYSLVVTDDFMTILNTSDHLGKFEGKANEGSLVGYAAHSKAYRVYNLSSKKVEETLNLRYLEDKHNVQGLGQEWYFDLDYLTDSLGYIRFKTNLPAGTHGTNILAGPTVHDVSAPIENNLDYAEELARLQRQEYEAHSATTKQGFSFSDDTATLVPASGVPAGSLPASGVPAGSLPASSVPAGGVLTRSIDSAEFGVPAASESVFAIFTNDPTDTSPLPPGHSLGSCKHTTRFPSPSNLGNHQPTASIFSSSSYDDDFCADVTNLALNVDVDHVATKRVNTIHPQSQIIRALQSPVQTRVGTDEAPLCTTGTSLSLT
nr:ribonuclease H-like domain-containing protein [Tanacetum cinerariifolium]